MHGHATSGDRGLLALLELITAFVGSVCCCQVGDYRPRICHFRPAAVTAFTSLCWCKLLFSEFLESFLRCHESCFRCTGPDCGSSLLCWTRKSQDSSQALPSPAAALMFRWFKSKHDCAGTWMTWPRRRLKSARSPPSVRMGC